MAAYYNEHDPFAAAWLRELIKAGHIAYGIVDERSIEDVRPSDLAGFTQCHFFAGIGVWSYALRRAGWPDDRPVWTGSCPCQPFSAAGKGNGFADERHLWPAWFHLITTAKPEAIPVFGEQVASKDGLAWLDLVQTDLEAAGHAFGAVDLCAAGVGAPHIRQRLFFVGHPIGEGLEGQRSGHCTSQGHGETAVRSATASGELSSMANTLPAGRTEGRAGAGCGQIAGGGEPGGMANSDGNSDRENFGKSEREKSGLSKIDRENIDSPGKSGRTDSPFCGLADADCNGFNSRSETTEAARHGRAAGTACGDAGYEQPGPTNGLWRSADWLFCRDGKWRPVEPGTFPLVNGAAARVGRLRGYGNAINAEVATAFIRAYLND